MKPGPIPTFRFVIIAVFMLLGYSLSGQMTPGKGLVLGTVIDTVRCAADPGQSYALYLPQAYSPEKAWPIMYIFEPGARGALPVERFQKAAEAYGYIVVGSNNSQNGSWKLSFDAANAMFDDTWSRFSIDTGRVYTAGFSGGARVACAVALNSGRIAGVIACGAGFPTVAEYQPRADMDFAFVGIVGNRDMNFLELNQVYDKLLAWELPAMLIEFDGRHVWPAPDTVLLAFDFLEVHAMRTGRLEKDADRIAAIKGRGLAMAEVLREAERPLDAVLTLQRLLYAMKGLADLSAEETQLASLSGQKATKKQLKARRQVLEREAGLQKAYSEQFMIDFRYPDDSASTAFWKDQGRLLGKMQTGKDREKALMADRLVNQLWVRCYELGQRAQAEGKHRYAATLFRTWTLVQPKAIYPNLRAAVSFTALGMKKKAIRYLEDAVENGLRDVKRIQIPELAALNGEKKFEKLREILNAKAIEEIGE